jgi:hypothetical protein
MQRDRLAVALLGVLAAGGSAAIELRDTEVPMTHDELIRSGNCSAQTNAIRVRFPDDLAAQLAAGEALSDECRGTGLYEYGMGSLNRKLGNTAEATRIFEDHVKRRLPNYENSAYQQLQRELEDLAKHATP